MIGAKPQVPSKSLGSGVCGLNPVRYTDCVQFEWDEAKNIANIDKHGIDFTEVQAVFDAPLLIDLDERQDYGEERWIGVGLLVDFVVVVVYVERRENTIRIISARNANRYERKRYKKFLTDGLGAA